jgi:tetratricopeptide (TPR) repeat protein
VTFLTIGIGGAGYYAWRQARIGGIVDTADELYNAQDYAAALEAYAQAFRLAPRRSDLLIDQGRCKLQLAKQNSGKSKGDLLREAAVLCKKGLELDPQDAAGHHLYAGVLRDLGDYPAALRSQQDALRLKPDSFEFWVNLGTLHALSKDLNEAAAAFEKAIALATKVTDRHLIAWTSWAWKNLAAVQAWRGDAEFSDSIRQAAQRDPDDPGYRVLRAKYLLRIGDYEGALRDLIIADDRLPEPDPIIKRLTALAYLHLGRLDQASLHADRALAAGDLPSYGLMVKVRKALAERDVGDAETDFDKANSCWPDHLRDPGSIEVVKAGTYLWIEEADDFLRLRKEIASILERERDGAKSQLDSGF